MSPIEKYCRSLRTRFALLEFTNGSGWFSDPTLVGTIKITIPYTGVEYISVHSDSFEDKIFEEVKKRIYRRLNPLPPEDTEILTSDKLENEKYLRNILNEDT